MPIAREVQWQAEAADQLLLQEPGLFRRHPHDLRMVGNPGVQPLLPGVGEGPRPAVPDALEADA